MSNALTTTRGSPVGFVASFSDFCAGDRAGLEFGRRRRRGLTAVELFWAAWVGRPV